MSAGQLVVIGGLITRSTLLLLYIPTLIHVLRGSRYTFVIGLILLLMGAQIFNLTLSIFFKALFIPPVKSTEFNIWGYGISIGLANTCFNVAHFWMAWIYRKIANDTPKLLEQETVDEQTKRSDDRKYWVLITLNILFPML